MRETDLLRRAAEYARDAHALEDHRLLYALADQMERAEPVAVRQWHDEFKCWNYDDIEDVLPSCKGERLYTHPAPEVTRDAEPVLCESCKAIGAAYKIGREASIPAEVMRDAEKWKREAEALWLCVAECTQALRDGVVNIPKLRAALDNVQEPKP